MSGEVKRIETISLRQRASELMAHRGIHMDEQKVRQGEIAELIVKKKLEDLPSGYSVIANVDIAAEGKSSELDTVVVTPALLLS